MIELMEPTYLHTTNFLMNASYDFQTSFDFEGVFTWYNYNAIIFSDGIILNEQYCEK